MPMTAEKGFPYISTKAEAQISWRGQLFWRPLAKYHILNIDAVIIAAFGDPGLIAAREIDLTCTCSRSWVKLPC